MRPAQYLPPARRPEQAVGLHATDGSCKYLLGIVDKSNVVHTLIWPNRRALPLKS
jgi:hypothetical protein